MAAQLCPQLTMIRVLVDDGVRARIGDVSRNFPFFIECFALSLSDIGIYFDELKENKDQARHPLRES
jgi:hypothetical protein